METSIAAAEDKKPELKTEPKEDDGSGTPGTPAGIPNKKKRENIFHKEIYIQDIPKCFAVWIWWFNAATHNSIFWLNEHSVWIAIKLLNCSKLLVVWPVFKPEELRQALMPTLESLYRQDPESLPFRQPVDPSLLGIPVCVTHHFWTAIRCFCPKWFRHCLIMWLIVQFRICEIISILQFTFIYL